MIARTILDMPPCDTRSRNFTFGDIPGPIFQKSKNSSIISFDNVVPYVLIIHLSIKKSTCVYIFDISLIGLTLTSAEKYFNEFFNRLSRGRT